MKKELTKLVIFTFLMLVILICLTCLIQYIEPVARGLPVNNGTEPEINFLLLLTTLILTYIAFIQLFKISETGKIDNLTQLAKLFKKKSNQKAISYLFKIYLSSDLKSYVEIIHQINFHLTPNNIKSSDQTTNEDIPIPGYRRASLKDQQAHYLIEHDDFIHILSLLDTLEFIGHLLNENKTTLKDIIGVCGNTILFSHDCLVTLAGQLEYKNFQILSQEIKLYGNQSHQFDKLRFIVSPANSEGEYDKPPPPRRRTNY